MTLHQPTLQRCIFAIVSKFAHSITAVSRDGTDIPEVRQVNLGGGRRPNLFEECRGRGGYFDIENTPCGNSMHRTGVDIFKIRSWNVPSLAAAAPGAV